ncbi:MAG: DOMON-like domain-containing protein [Alphaproteobacteria bacterium]|nr:DOMON-like domain-containing protein [Alphaproteobacteria bacterium]
MAATGVEAEAARPGSDSLLLRFIVTGVIADLFLPPATATERTDELWRHTCFEAFVRAGPGTAYYEFNFAPSTQWAAYRFDGYRCGMSVASTMGAPRIEVRSDGGSYELQASLALDHLPDLPRDAAWRLGLSAVIEEADGNISYWALAHPPGKPDFHHSDCFTLELPSA